jgi:multiple sugar transport system ATP-binding protein
VAGFIGSPKMNFMSVFIEAVEKDRVMVQLANGTTFWIPVDGTTVTRGGSIKGTYMVTSLIARPD